MGLSWGSHTHEELISIFCLAIFRKCFWSLQILGNILNAISVYFGVKCGGSSTTTADSNRLGELSIEAKKTTKKHSFLRALKSLKTNYMVQGVHHVIYCRLARHDKLLNNDAHILDNLSLRAFVHVKSDVSSKEQKREVQFLPTSSSLHLAYVWRGHACCIVVFENLQYLCPHYIMGNVWEISDSDCFICLKHTQSLSFPSVKIYTRRSDKLRDKGKKLLCSEKCGVFQLILTVLRPQL